MRAMAVRSWWSAFVPAPTRWSPSAMMKELTARFVVAYDKADFDMIAGLMAMDKIAVTDSVYRHRGLCRL